MKWRVEFTKPAQAQLAAISDKRIQQEIFNTAQGLENEPEKQGKPMIGNLAGCRSVRAVGQRYRIIYRVRQDLVEVVVLTVGIRKDGDKKDAYELASNLQRRGLLEPAVVPIEDVHIFPRRPTPVTGKVLCPKCRHEQAIEISKAQLRLGYSFVQSCESCKIEFTSKFKQPDYLNCLEQIFGSGPI